MPSRYGPGVGLRGSSAVDAARWVVDGFGPGRTARHGGLAETHAPAPYEAYARVFHAPVATDAAPTWSATAAANGKIAHPLMEWHQIYTRGIDDDSKLPWGGWDIGAAEVAAIAAALRGDGEGPRCHFLIWEGYNRPGLQATGAAAIEGLGEGAYLLFTGSLGDAAKPLEQKTEDGWSPVYTAPNLWWPEDRTWFVFTDIDSESTYISGAREAIDRLLAADGIETMELQRDDNIGLDLVNGTQ